MGDEGEKYFSTELCGGTHVKKLEILVNLIISNHQLQALCSHVKNTGDNLRLLANPQLLQKK